jgi:hypothetical protein
LISSAGKSSGEGVHENINHVSETVGICREFDKHHGAFIGG